MEVLKLRKKVLKIPQHITHLYLRYDDCDITEIEWPPNLQFLECYFRPFFGYLPTTIETLSFVSQREVRKQDLPKNVKELHLTCPNACTRKFRIDDEFDLYKIEIHDFGKYNAYVGGFDNYDEDNLEHFRDVVFFNYDVQGDDYIPAPPRAW
jgi:hypothetical protein